MIEFFTTTLSWVEDGENSIKAPLKNPIRVSWDRKNESAENWKQQELFLGAINLAISQTFLALCRIKNIDVESLNSNATGKFESGDQFKKISEVRYNLDVGLKNKEFSGLLNKILHDAKARCGILRVLNLEIEVNLKIIS